MIKYVYIRKVFMTHLNMSNIIHDARVISIYRPPGSREHAFVRSHLTSRLMMLGMECECQKFMDLIRNDGRDELREFTNIIARNPRNDINQGMITLGAHYDSAWLPRMPASIDAAVSCAVILELTRVLLAYNQSANIMIVFFDGEETQVGEGNHHEGIEWDTSNALYGSKYFVNNFDLNLITHFYLLDLWGGTKGENGDACRFLSNSREMVELYKINKEIFPQNIIYMPVKLPLRIMDDHVPLREKGVEVTELIAWPFPCQWHKVCCDTINNVDWSRVYIAAGVLLKRLIMVC